MFKYYHLPAVRLRPVTVRDIEPILGLEIACFSRTEEMFNRRQVLGLIANPRAIVVVAESKKRVLGWAAGLIHRHGQNYSGRLYAVAVHPDAQGKRIGQRMIERILRVLAMRGASRIFLEVHADNQKAINLYRKLGFTDRGYLADYYGPGHHGLRMMRPVTNKRTKNSSA